jgi:hypothetical protein
VRRAHTLATPIRSSSSYRRIRKTTKRVAALRAHDTELDSPRRLHLETGRRDSMFAVAQIQSEFIHVSLCTPPPSRSS